MPQLGLPKFSSVPRSEPRTDEPNRRSWSGPGPGPWLGTGGPVHGPPEGGWS